MVTLVWGLPLLAGFTVAALLAPATGCDPALSGGVPCDLQGEVVLLGVMSAVLLIPVGLVALVLVRVLGRPRLAPARVRARPGLGAGRRSPRAASCAPGANLVS